MNEPDPLRPMLNAWQPELTPSPDLANRVLAQLDKEQSPRIARKSYRPSLILQCIAACILIGVGVVAGMAWKTYTLEQEAEQRAAWLLSIDPVRRVHVTNGSPSGSLTDLSPLERLDWMRQAFELSPRQFARLGQLQADFEPEFNALYGELVMLDAEYHAYEIQRRRGGSIDFIALHELLRERALLHDSAEETSARFVTNLVSVLRPPQKLAFRAFLNRSAPHLVAPFSTPPHA